jgi:hypothetical protein
MAGCFYHPEHPGVGVCMRCRRVICAGCCTRLDGINHCFACIEEIGRSPEATGMEVVGALLRFGMLLGGVLLLFIAFWSLQGKLAP